MSSDDVITNELVILLLTEAFLLNPTDGTCLLGRTSLVNSKLDNPPERAVPATICEVILHSM